MLQHEQACPPRGQREPTSGRVDRMIPGVGENLKGHLGGSVEHLTLGFGSNHDLMGSNPTSGSVLAEPALDSVSLSLPFPVHVFSLFLSK